MAGMKKFFLLFILSITAVWASSIPSELLERLEIPQNLPETELVAEIGKRWNQTGKERWEYENRHEGLKDELAPIFQKMGYLDEISPSQQKYDYAIVHGATLARVKSRTASLKKALASGVKINQIVFLTGMRELETWEKEALPENIYWEWEMVEYVYQTSDLPKEIAVKIINAKAPSNQKRPSTIHTVAAWLEQKPTPGSCLAFSNQPYVPYQHAVLKNLLPEGLSLETVGDKAENWSVALVLDTIAKTEKNYVEK